MDSDPSPDPSTVKSRLRLLPLTAAAVMAVMAALSSCSEEHRERVADINDTESVPTMTTTNVATFISDSGYTRYHITTPVWYVYDEAKVPRWTFPDGLFLEKYDDFFRPDATLRCDSAVYFSQKKLWRLDGNVRMRNTAGDRFLTQQLFWDQASRTVYSDSFIHIERSDRIIEGYGFNSNENMTRYTVRRPSGIFPVNRDATEKSDTSSTRTAQRQAASNQPKSATQPPKSAASAASVTESDTPPSFKP